MNLSSFLDSNSVVKTVSVWRDAGLEVKKMLPVKCFSLNSDLG